MALVFLIFTSINWAQEKSKILYSKEILRISSGKNLEIESEVLESRWIAKSNNTQDYSIRTGFDSFSDVFGIKGFTINEKSDKKSNLSSMDISLHDAEDSNIFKSDSKYYYFMLPNVEDNSTITYSYKNRYKQPRLLSSFHFQNQLATENAMFQIKCLPSISIGYKLFGNFQDKIIFSKTKEDEFDVYTWEAKDLPAFESEAGMPNYKYFLPHLIYYVKDYEIKGIKNTLLNTPNELYKWYFELVKDINKKDETALKNKSLELIKDKKTDFEKAKTIYQWIQQNLHYVAFENGMGGFVPREAGDIFEKRYGDCKDMANILNQMLRYAKLDAHLTWVGTRSKPYTYIDVPTPIVDNHMITNVLLDGKSYFLDGTDKFCPFGFPSSMIQGKEALIGKSENDFKIEKITEVPANLNVIDIKMKLSLQNNDVIGTADALISGLPKSDFLNRISANNQKELVILKDIIASNNKKINLEVIAFTKNDYQDSPSKIEYSLKFENVIKDINSKTLLKPLLLFPLKELAIDIESRKLSIENDFAYQYDISYEYEIPEGSKIEFLPENAKTENELGAFEIQYKVLNNKINVTQKIISKKLMLQTKDFNLWNVFIKSLNKQYNQSIILTK